MPAISRHLGDAAGVAEVGLQDRRGLLLQHLAEAPLGEDALAGGDRQVRAAGDLGHDVVVLAVDRLLDEHRLVRLQRLDQQLGRRRADRAVEVDGDVDVVAGRLAQLGELLGGVLHGRGGLDVARGPPLGRAGLEGGEARAPAAA